MGNVCIGCRCTKAVELKNVCGNRGKGPEEARVQSGAVEVAEMSVGVAAEKFEGVKGP